MRRATRILALAALASHACGGGFDPPSLVKGLRLLGVKADPPEVHVGDRVSLQALAVDPTGDAIAIAWAICTAPYSATTGQLNEDCITVDEAPFLTPIGEGPSAAMTVPDVKLTALGYPDATGGLYLPIRLRLRTAHDALDAVYRLRMATVATVNHNPVLSSVSIVTRAADGALASDTPLVEGQPVPVASGQTILLRGRFADGSAEPYWAIDFLEGGADQVVDQLSISWFTTAGHFDSTSTGPDVDNPLLLDRALPPAGSTIDLWVVGRDDRGGMDPRHFSLLLR